ncbi:MAG TPA: hypothetical protein VH590_10100 [Ktedonobacterales bacterium]|jgi:hypothetical protein
MPEEMPFTPEEIDEQIERLAQAPHPPQPAAPPEQQLVAGLRALFAAETEQITRAQQRGRGRLARRRPAIFTPLRGRHTSALERSSVERQSSMQHIQARFGGEHQRLYRLGSLVAAALLVVLVGGLVAGLILVRQNQSAAPIGTAPNFTGGLEIVFQASCNVPSKHCTPNTLALLSSVSAILKGRVVDGLGVSQVAVHQQGSDQIVVDLPPQVRTQDALALLTPDGKLEIIDTGANSLAVGTIVQPGKYPVRFTGVQLDLNSIHALLDPQSGLSIITFQFKSQYQAAFASYTQQNIGNFLTMTLDDKVIESAQIQGQITGQGQITSGYTLADAQATAALLRYGSLPLPLTIVSEKTITNAV